MKMKIAGKARWSMVARDMRGATSADGLEERCSTVAVSPDDRVHCRAVDAAIHQHRQPERNPFRNSKPGFAAFAGCK